MAIIIAFSVSLIGSQAEEVVSSRIMSYAKTVTSDHFASNFDNVRVNPLTGGYGAATIRTASAICWISPDGYAILIDYIAGGTLTIENGQKPEIIFKIADLMRKVHALQKETISSEIPAIVRIYAISG